MSRCCSVTRRWLAALGLAGMCAALAACSSSSGVYPAMFANPGAPTDTTLSPDQVQQATQNLITDREHLQVCAAAMANPAVAEMPPGCAPANTAAAGAAAKP
jgi:hypothetical protein